MRKNKNYLENIPCRKPEIKWECGDDGLVSLIVENKGVFNRISQVLLGRPQKSYIHLDSLGSYIWTQLDGEKNISDIADFVHSRFGEDAEPLHERICKFFSILKSYGFVIYK